MGQMTMTTPERRITLQRSQRGLTEAETFIDRLSHPVRDSTPGEVVGTQLDADGVARQDADEVLSQLAGDVGQYLVPVLQAHLEHRVREWGHDLTLDLDGILFRQALRTLNLLLKTSLCGTQRKAAAPGDQGTESIPESPSRRNKRPDLAAPLGATKRLACNWGPGVAAGPRAVQVWLEIRPLGS